MKPLYIYLFNSFTGGVTPFSYPIAGYSTGMVKNNKFTGRFYPPVN
jgi:hypothetical protein